MEIVEAIQSYNLYDVSTKFKSRRRKPHNWTWRCWRDGEKIQSICDYILASEQMKFRNFVTTDVAFDSDHRLLTAKISLDGNWRKYKAYRSNREAIPFRLFPTVSNQNNDDQLIRGLQEEIEVKSPSMGPDRSWISEGLLLYWQEKQKYCEWVTLRRYER